MPSIGKVLRICSNVRVRVIADTNALQAELRSGRVDIAPLPTSLSPDAVKLLGEDPKPAGASVHRFQCKPADVQLQRSATK